MYCERCGGMVREEDRFCRTCGKKIDRQPRGRVYTAPEDCTVRAVPRNDPPRKKPMTWLPAVLASGVVVLGTILGVKYYLETDDPASRETVITFTVPGQETSAPEETAEPEEVRAEAGTKDASEAVQEDVAEAAAETVAAEAAEEPALQETAAVSNEPAATYAAESSMLTRSDVPGPHDLMGCNEKVVCPKERNWLGKYETKYVQTKNGKAAYMYYKPDAGSTRYAKVSDKEKVTVLARENGFSLVRTAAGSAGWVESSVLKNKYTGTAQKPGITSQPSDRFAEPGDKITFKVKASGNNLKYQWYYREVGSEKWVKIKNGTKASLTVSVHQQMDGRQYRCRVSNSAGSTYTQPAAVWIC